MIIPKILDVLFGLSLIALIVTSVYAFFLTHRIHLSLFPELELTSGITNLRLGSVVDSIVIIFICFILFVRYFLPLEKNKKTIGYGVWSNFLFNILMAIIVFFFAGILGVVTSCFHILVTTMYLIFTLWFKKRKKDIILKEEEDESEHTE